jgi:hypothetical protein
MSHCRLPSCARGLPSDSSGGDLEGLIESCVGRLDVKLGREDDQGEAHRLDDRLGELLRCVDLPLPALAVGDFGEGHDHAVDPVVLRSIRHHVADVPTPQIVDHLGVRGQKPVEHLHLEAELLATREDLRLTLEQLEASNEELKASNEEIRSINEELQASNEELETSKEELQSLNEELNTTNNQLQAKVEELEVRTNDLKNLLNSTDVATLFLDRSLCIRWFTPSMKALLELLPSDVGRPISHLAQRFSGGDLLEDARIARSGFLDLGRPAVFGPLALEEAHHQGPIAAVRVLERFHHDPNGLKRSAALDAAGPRGFLVVGHRRLHGAAKRRGEAIACQGEEVCSRLPARLLEVVAGRPVECVHAEAPIDQHGGRGETLEQGALERVQGAAPVTPRVVV